MCEGKFKLVINAGSDFITEEMFRYGYCCGLANKLDLDCIRDAFASNDFSGAEETFLLKNICEGYDAGTDFNMDGRLN